MAPLTDSEALLRRHARRLHWGLMLYLVVLLLIGIGVLRLAYTARRFDRLTVAPVEDTAIGAGDGRDDTSGGVVVPVSGAAP
jgi:hypothetical protein